jgi:hypothetical protein
MARFNMLRRFYNSSPPFRKEALLRIGSSIQRIPTDYDDFFDRPCRSIISAESYDPIKFRLFLHLNSALPTEIEGKGEVSTFLCRLRFLMKWGHFFWRLSDLSVLQFVPIRVIKPLDFSTSGPVELKIHWQLQLLLNEGIFWIDGTEKKMSLVALLKVQYYRLFGYKHRQPFSVPPKVLYTGINRYCFDADTGYCTELHVERIEPLLFGKRKKATQSSLLESSA